MNRIDLLRKDRKHLIVYLMAGDPDMAATEGLIYTLADRGVSLIELGVPFTDPMADGPSIQRAGERALKNRVTLRQVLSLARKVRKRTQVPLVFMTYYNIIFNYGGRKFIDDAVKAGVDGAIIPDLPFDEEKDFYDHAVKSGFHLIYLVSPANSEQRIRKLVDKCRGFVYYILLKGVTGARKKSEADYSNIKNIKKYTSKPVFAGFGISAPQQAAAALKHADGVIIGSAFVDLVARYGRNRGGLMKHAGKFAEKFMDEVKNA